MPAITVMLHLSHPKQLVSRNDLYPPAAVICRIRMHYPCVPSFASPCSNETAAPLLTCPASFAADGHLEKLAWKKIVKNEETKKEVGRGVDAEGTMGGRFVLNVGEAVVEEEEEGQEEDLYPQVQLQQLKSDRSKK